MVRLSKEEALLELDRERHLSQSFGGCVMCRLASPQHQAEWLAENEHGFVVLDAYGSTRGHVLVIAKHHVERTSELSASAFGGLQQLVWQANIALENAFAPLRIYTATLGAAKPLPMSFPHWHSHVVPVYEEDERARPASVFSWSAGVECYSSSDGSRLQAEIRNAWS
jgi:diadenosine tetraphosphate (Ap4A) HIT family hydrolase